MKVHFLRESEYKIFLKKNKEHIFRAVEFTHSLEKSTDLLSKASVAPITEKKYEVWVSKEKVRTKTVQGVRFATAGNLTYCRFESDERPNLEKTAYRLYENIFSILKKEKLHLVRIWNYIPHILDDGGTLERYRQFNLGRNKAWNKRGPKDENGNLIVPAASGIGALGGPLKIGVLFSKEKPIHIKNPRQINAYNYSKAYGPKPPMFSRATYLKGIGLFISGTASIVGEKSVHHNNPEEQTRETLRNITALISKKNLEAHGIQKSYTLKNVTDWRIYIKNIYQAQTIEKVFLKNLAKVNPNHILLHDDICRDNLLVEIEGTVFE